MKCNGWICTTIGEQLVLQRGYDISKTEQTEGRIPVISSSGVKSYHNQYKERGPGVLLGRKGSIGTVYYTEDDYWPHSTTLFVKDFRGNSPEFVYYFFLSIAGKLKNMDVGTSNPTLNRNHVHPMCVVWPSVGQQKKIVCILRALDKQIELNNKINKNLEQQARALLTQWLIENEGTYEFYLLSKVAVINPDTYSLKDAWEFVNYLDTSSITDGIISEIQHIKPSTEKLPSRARRIIAANDVVFSTVRPNQRHFGIINDPLDNMLASTGFAVVRSNHPSVSNELLYLCLTEDSFIEKMQQLAEQSTSTFPSIKPSDLGGCEIPCPISQELTKTLKAIFASISNNQKQNRALSEFRDTLLPKLMSGEINIDF